MEMMVEAGGWNRLAHDHLARPAPPKVITCGGEKHVAQHRLQATAALPLVVRNVFSKSRHIFYFPAVSPNQPETWNWANIIRIET
jgi:hypothetical protein